MFNDDNRWRESWRRVWAPGLSTTQLEAAAEALACNDARLGQRIVAMPMPTETFPDVQCSNGCAIACAVWLPLGPRTSREVIELWEEQLAEAVRRAPASDPQLPWRFLTWFDSTPWEDVRRGLLGEVSRSLGMRALQQADMTVAEEPVVVLIAS